jgi:hypothetical protein
MTNLGKWNAPTQGTTPTSIFSTALNSLANGAMSAASGVWDNTTNNDLFMFLAVNLASLSPATGAFFTIYALASLDGGTTYGAQSASDLRLMPDLVFWACPIGVTASTPQFVVSKPIPILPVKYKFFFDNETGVALNASGNTMVGVTAGYNLNG